MSASEIKGSTTDTHVVKDPSSGTQFSVSVRPSTDVEAILEAHDPDNEVFFAQEINVGNQEFTMVLGRSHFY